MNNVEQAAQDARALAASEEPMDMLQSVLSVVSRRVRFQSDQEAFGVRQRTLSAEDTLARGAGDCEDFALVCMEVALVLGVPQDLLSVDYCLMDGATAHAVLNYSAGAAILDNQTETARPLARRYDLSDLRPISLASMPRHAGDADPGLRLT